MSALTSLLLRDAVLGVEDIENAIQRQVDAGGTMDTALLEIELVAENTLAAYWAASHGLPAVPRERLQQIDLSILQRVPRRLADAHRMVPIGFQDGLLDIVFAAAPPVAVLDHLAVTLEAEVAPHIGLHISVVDALHRYYGVEMSRREVALIGALQGRDPGSLRPVNKPASPEERRARLRTPRYGFQLPPTANGEALRRGARASSGFGVPFIKAQQRLARADDPEEVIGVLLDFARVYFDFLAVFAVHQDVARGRQAIGGGGAAEHISSIAIPLDIPSAFARACGGLAPARFSADGELDAVVAEDLGLMTLEGAWVVPIAREGHVTLLVVAVGGPLGGDEEALQPLSAIAPAVAKALGRQPVRRPSLPPYAYQTSSGDLEAASARGRVTVLGLPASPFDPRLFPDPLPWPEEREAVQKDSTTLIPPALFEEVVLSSPGLTSDAEEGLDVAVSADRDSETEVPPPFDHDHPKHSSMPDLDHLVRVLAQAEPQAADDIIDQLLPHEDVVLAVLTECFPGRLWWDRRHHGGSFPRAEDFSAIARCLIRIGPHAFHALVPHLESGGGDIRLAALAVAAELLDEELMPYLCRRVFDVDEEVRSFAVALMAKRAHHGASWQAMLSGLRAAARVHRPESTVRLVSVQVLGELRDPLSLTLLIDLVGDPDAEIAAAAKAALTLMTGQDLGLSTRGWWQWADGNRSRHRAEWLIDGLGGPREAVREIAARELETLTEHYVGYHPGLPDREREACQSRYRDWWQREGRALFEVERGAAP